MWDTIRKELEHIRLVHFTTLAVSGACLYLLSSASQLRAQLVDFGMGYEFLGDFRFTSRLRSEPHPLHVSVFSPGLFGTQMEMAFWDEAQLAIEAIGGGK